MILQRYTNSQGMFDYNKFVKEFFGQIEVSQKFAPAQFFFNKETKEYGLKVIAAGIDKEDLTISLESEVTTNSNLLIISKRKKENEINKNIVMIENRISEKDFHIRIPFHKSIDEDSITAELKKGILYVHWKLLENKKIEPKLIEIKGEDYE